MILHLFAYAVAASLAVGTATGLLARLANRQRSSGDVDTAAEEPVKHTEPERLAALAELVLFDPDDPVHVAKRAEEDWLAEWHVFWESHAETVRLGEAFLGRQLDERAPGWREAICENHRCTLCAHTFDEAKTMAAAGAIALPAAAVDYGTAEYPVLVTA